MWFHLTKQLSLENLPFRRACARTTHKIAVAYLGRPRLVRGQVLRMYGFRFWARKIVWTLDFSIPISREHCLNDFFGDRAKTCMTASALPSSTGFLFIPHRPFSTSCTVPSTSNLSRNLVIVTPGGRGGVPNSTLQHFSQKYFPITLQQPLTFIEW